MTFCTRALERKYLTLRMRIKRLVRKTICFSKSTQMHDLVIGLFINRYEFGVQCAVTGWTANGMLVSPVAGSTVEEQHCGKRRDNRR